MVRWVAVAACLLGLAFTGSTIWRAGSDRIRKGTDDFLALYAGARLVGTPELYHPPSIYREEIRAAGMAGDTLVCTRMPWVPLLLWPLGQLPYQAAHAVWLALRIAAVIAFIWIWPHNPKWIVAVAVSWFLPVMAALGTGQDVIWVLFCLGVWQRLEPKRPFLSGMVLALCAAKFHLFLLLPVYLIANRRWRVIGGASTGVLLLLALSFAANGRMWPLDYWRLLSNPVVMLGQMYSLHGMLSLSWAQELALSMAVALAATWGIWRLGPANGLAIALSGSLLLSYHAFLMDCVVLLPALLLALGRFTGARPSACAA